MIIQQHLHHLLEAYHGMVHQIPQVDVEEKMVHLSKKEDMVQMAHHYKISIMTTIMVMDRLIFMIGMGKREAKEENLLILMEI